MKLLYQRISGGFEGYVYGDSDVPTRRCVFGLGVLRRGTRPEPKNPRK